MRRRNHAQALKSAAGTCRERRRPESPRRRLWVRPIRRLHRALDSSVHLISRSLLSAGASERRAQRRPIRSSRELEKVEDLILLASSRLSQAARELSKVHACIARDPENAGDAPELLILATERWIFMAGWLAESAGSVFDRHQDVLDGIRNGTLVPERSAFPRPRIIPAPRPVPIRAFLLCRQHRVRDRIAPLLHRRRRTPRPAALTVPNPVLWDALLLSFPTACSDHSQAFERRLEIFMSTVEVTGTPISHSEAAQQRVQELRRWRELIPHFVTPESTDESRRLIAAASVPPEFIELTNVAVANQTALVRGDGATPAETRDLVSYADAYDPLADELEALAQFLRHSTRTARNIAGTEALNRYAMARRLAKQRKTAHLAPHVADMRRALGRVRPVSPEVAAQKAAAKAAIATKRAAKAAARAAKTPPNPPASTPPEPTHTPQ